MTEENTGLERITTQTPWKAIVLFSVPVLIGNMFQQLYSVVDAVIVGRLIGVLPFAGVGATGAMSFLVIGFATGITGGFSVVTAQRAGQKDEERIRSSVAASMCLCLVIGLILTAVSGRTAVPLLRLMNTPEDIFKYSYQYILIIYLGLCATIYYNLMAGLLRAIGDSRTPLYVLFFSSVLNVVLDLSMILLFHLGVRGAALATVLSQLISAVICHVYAEKTYAVLRPDRRNFEAVLKEVYVHLRIGLPMALQFSVTAVGIMILQAYLNRFGSLVIAGYTAAGKVENFVTQPFIALSMTMEVYCGQNYGAGDWKRIRRGIRSSIVIGFFCVLLASGINVVFGRSLIALFLDQYNEQVVEYGYAYLMVIAVFFLLLCSLQILRSSLQGMGEAAVPMAGGVVELIARWAGCAAMAGPLGYVGVYLSTPLAWGLALSLLIVRYLQIMGTCRSGESIGKYESETGKKKLY